MTRRVRRTAAVAGALLAAAALSACGEKQNVLTPTAARAQPLTVMLPGQPGPEDVGLYAGLASGGFQAAGLDVRVQSPAGGSSPLQELQAGKIDVAVASEPELLQARNTNAPLVAIGAIAQQPLQAIVSLASKHIASPAQLRGRTVGDAGTPLQRAFLATVLAHAGVAPTSVKQVHAGANLLAALTSGHIAAALGATWNADVPALTEQGKHPTVIHLEKAGVPTYDELVLVTTEDEIAGKTNALRRFVQALGRAYGAVRSNPADGATALTKANPSLNAGLALAGVRASLPAFFPHDPRNPNLPWGWLDGGQWTAFGEWMLRQHLISNPAAVAAAETNMLLAGQGP